MNFLVIGAGNIAHRHIRNLKQLLPTAQITLWRQQPGIPEPQWAGFIQRIITTEADAFSQQYAAAIIASPAPLHVPTAQHLAARGVHLLVEKPLSNTLEGIDTLIRTCEQHNTVMMVGYNLRFHAALQTVKTALEDGRIGRILSLRAEVGQYLPDWRPGKDYRQSVSAQRDLGGGAIFELSHELDYLRWLGGEIRSVAAQTAKVSDLQMTVEDTADILLQFASGAVGSIHVDMIERAPYRRGRVSGADGTLVWDVMAPAVNWYSAEKRAWQTLFLPEHFDHGAMYVSEMQHFLDCIGTGQTPLVSGGDAKRIVELALAAHQSAQTGQRVAV